MRHVNAVNVVPRDGRLPIGATGGSPTGGVTLAAVASLAAVLSSGCVPFLGAGAIARGDCGAISVPVPTTRAPFARAGAGAVRETRFAEISRDLLQAPSARCSVVGLGAGRATRRHAGRAWTGWAAGLAILDVRSDDGTDGRAGPAIPCPDGVGAFLEFALHDFRWGGIKARLIVAPDAGPDDGRVSGIMVTYRFGYEPAKTFSAVAGAY